MIPFPPDLARVLTLERQLDDCRFEQLRALREARAALPAKPAPSALRRLGRRWATAAGLLRPATPANQPACQTCSI